MIRVQVIDNCSDHFVVYADEPVRVEVSMVSSKYGGESHVVAHVYEGVGVDEEQEPLGAYDGTSGDDVGWQKR